MPPNLDTYLVLALGLIVGAFLIIKGIEQLQSRKRK